MILINTLILFLEIIQILIIIDIVLSWLTLAWLKIRPKFIADIIDPLYKKVKDYIPTNFWAFELAPIIVYFLIQFIIGSIVIVFK